MDPKRIFSMDVKEVVGIYFQSKFKIHGRKENGEKLYPKESKSLWT